MKHYMMSESEIAEVRQLVIGRIDDKLATEWKGDSMLTVQAKRCINLVTARWFDHEILEDFDRDISNNVEDFIGTLMDMTPMDNDEFDVLAQRIHWVQIG